MDMLTQGFFAAVMILWLLTYLNLRRVFALAGWFDIVITLGLMYAFKGSYAGLMTGVFAGVIVSVVMKFGGKIMGTERLRLVRAKGKLLPSPTWVRERGWFRQPR